MQFIGSLASYFYKQKDDENTTLISQDENNFIIEDPNHQTINQIHRKIKLMNEFKIYIENSDSNSLYYKHIINTIVFEGEKFGSKYLAKTFIIKAGIFGYVYHHNYINDDSNTFFNMLLEL